MLSAALLLTALSPASQDAARREMSLKLKVGSVITSELQLQFENKEDEFLLIQKQSWVTTVVKMEAQFYELEHKVRTFYESMDGVERPAYSPDATLLTESRTVRGIIRRFEGSDVDPVAQLWLARFRTVPLPSLPPALGDSWEFSDLRELAYKFTGTPTQFLDGKSVVKFSFAGENSPQKANGTATLDLATGWPMRVEADFVGTQIPGGEGERYSGKLTWVTQSIVPPK